MSDKNATKKKLMEFIEANGYMALARADIIDDTQPGDVWMKHKTTGRVHVEISFDGEACVETFTNTSKDGNWR